MARDDNPENMPFRLADFLPFRVNRLTDQLTRRIMPVYRGMFDLSRPEWRILAHLGASGPNTARDLVGLTALDKVQVSRAVAALEDRGWLERAVDDGDRRVNRLRLTEKGAAAFNRLAPEMVAAQERVLTALTPEQRARVEAALTDLETVLGIGPQE